MKILVIYVHVDIATVESIEKLVKKHKQEVIDSIGDGDVKVVGIPTAGNTRLEVLIWDKNENNIL